MLRDFRLVIWAHQSALVHRLQNLCRIAESILSAREQILWRIYWTNIALAFFELVLLVRRDWIVLIRL